MLLVQKAKSAQALVDQYGFKEGVHMPFHGTGDESNFIFKGFDGQGDGAFYSGIMLASQCERLKLALKNNEEKEISRAKQNIGKITQTFIDMQKFHGKGLIARNIVRGSSPDDWVKGITESGVEYRWSGFITFDQVLSVLFGYHHCLDVIDHLPEQTQNNIKLGMKQMVEHFVGHNGYIGHQTNLRAEPWYISFLWKHIMRIFTPGRWNTKENDRGWIWKLEDWFNWYAVPALCFIVFKLPSMIGMHVSAKHIIYRAGILQYAFDLTSDEKYSILLSKHLKRYKRAISKMRTDHKVPGIAKWAARMMWRIKNKKWSVPEDIKFDPKHLDKGIGKQLLMTALYPLEKNHGGEDVRRLFAETWDRGSPLLMGMKYKMGRLRSIQKNIFNTNLNLFRIPNTFNEGKLVAPKAKYLKWNGDAKEQYVNELPYDLQNYHTALSQTNPFKHAEVGGDTFLGLGEFLYGWYVFRNTK